MEKYQAKIETNLFLKVGGNEILMKKLTPNFEPGCRRILFHSDFLPMFQNRPDKAHLITGKNFINCKHFFVASKMKHFSDPISEITGTGIMAGNHHYKFDLVRILDMDT